MRIRTVSVGRIGWICGRGRYCTSVWKGLETIGPYAFKGPPHQNSIGPVWSVQGPRSNYGRNMTAFCLQYCRCGPIKGHYSLQYVYNTYLPHSHLHHLHHLHHHHLSTTSKVGDRLFVHHSSLCAMLSMHVKEAEKKRQQLQADFSA